MVTSSMKIGNGKKIPIKVGLMLPKDNIYLKPTIGFATSASACSIALERVAKEQLLINVNWR